MWLRHVSMIFAILQTAWSQKYILSSGGKYPAVLTKCNDDYGTFPATIHSFADNEDVRQTCAEGNVQRKCYIGLTDNVIDGTFAFEDGSEVNQTLADSLWLNGAPANSNTKNCVIIRGEDGKWESLECDGNGGRMAVCNAPTPGPTTDPTIDPTINPTFDPTNNPSVYPSVDPTIDPTSDPTNYPTMTPSPDPTAKTDSPTFNPTLALIPPKYILSSGGKYPAVLTKCNDDYGTFPATIHSLADNEEARQTCAEGNIQRKCYIGLTDNVIDGTFAFEDGFEVNQTLADSLWLNGAPANSNTKNCVIIRGEDGKWDSLECDGNGGRMALCNAPTPGPTTDPTKYPSIGPTEMTLDPTLLPTNEPTTEEPTTISPTITELTIVSVESQEPSISPTIEPTFEQTTQLSTVLSSDTTESSSDVIVSDNTEDSTISNGTQGTSCRNIALYMMSILLGSIGIFV